MKTATFLLHLLLSAGYPAALLAELLGLLPSNTMTLPMFMGVYVATGVLAVAFLDYVRKPSAVGEPGQVRRQPVAAASRQPTVSTWVLLDPMCVSTPRA